LVPSNVLDRMMVYKSGSPENPGDFSGGLVKIFTSNALEEKFTSFTISTGFRPNTNFSPYYQTAGSSTDWLGFDNSRALPANFPSTRIFTESSTRSQLRRDAAHRLANNYTISERTALPNMGFGFGLGRYWDLGHVRISTISVLNYSQSQQY